ERATRYYNDLRALTFQQKGQELAEAPVVSTAELEQVRRQVWVQRQLLECHEEVLNGLEQDEYGAERKQAVLGKPRSQTEPSPESGKVLDLPRPFALTEADTGEPAGAAQPAQTVMARGETRKDLEA
ncbi:MAG: hypothetical protein NT154_09650, partial [Verrucomicrobia bacterium]|nr:hypothetical protein [Verrucomicrobiota bacterium]